MSLKEIPIQGEDEIKYMNIHICGYSCYKRCCESKKIPKILKPHIINTEDFEGYLYPDIHKKIKNFEYLTAQEIREMTDQQKQNYFIEKEKQDLIDPYTSEIHDELFEEDNRIYRIEIDEISDENSDYIDDY
tara:strand:+ start:228 stop:623 length:396 start_codon:yes stop_codon:yes gene_type:complete